MEEARSSQSNEGMQNSIDQLPDEVLISIVSLLSVKEAVRTSVLARRWRYFWVFNPILDFDGSEMVHKLEIRRKVLESERIKFVGSVNRVLDLHSRETIDEFRLRFDLDNRNTDDIDRWLEFAFSKKVKRLELDLTPTYSGSFEHEEYALEKYITRVQCASESLVSLSLTRVHVTREVLHLFVSNCPFLEELHLDSVDGIQTLTLNSQVLRLKRLAVVDCPRLAWVKIGSPHLVSCTFSTRGRGYISMEQEHVSSELIDLSLGAPTPSRLAHNLHTIPSCLSWLETLTLNTTTKTDHGDLEFMEFPKLKKLVLEIYVRPRGSILCFTPLLNAAPLLREIVLKLKWETSFDHESRVQHPVQRRQLECLKVFEIEGFALRAVVVEMVLYVLENARSLDHMIIYGEVVTGNDLALLKEKLRHENYGQEITGSLLLM